MNKEEMNKENINKEELYKEEFEKIYYDFCNYLVDYQREESLKRDKEEIKKEIKK